MSIRRKIIENAEARKKNRLLNRNNNNVGNNNFASQGMKEKDYDFDRILAGDIPPELDKPHDDTLFFQIIFGAVCLFVFYIPFWSGNGGVFTYLNEQTMLHLPSVYHIPDNIHTLWEKGEYNKGYEYNVKVKFSDELPFDIVRYLPENYLSFSIDIEHIIGQKNDTIDFSDERLHRLIQPLLPFYLKVGGKEADQTYYDMEEKILLHLGHKPPPNYKHVLNATMWEQLLKFVDQHRRGVHGIHLIFTLNYGPGPRIGGGWISNSIWTENNADALLQYTKEKGYHGIDVIELGHELNMHYKTHSLFHHPNPKQYSRDIKMVRKKFSKLLHERCIVVGQPSVFLPLFGEQLGIFFGFFRQFYFAEGGLSSQAYDFHYYPMHETHTHFTLAGRYALPRRILDPDVLDDVIYWTEYVEKWREQYSGHSPLWMGGTALTPESGEPEISDSFLGGIWWLDHISNIAANSKVNMIIRDHLTGPSLNSLLDLTIFPRPDYWNTLLWKNIMGPKVYQVESTSEYLRAYAHSMKNSAGKGVAFLFINLDTSSAANVEIPLPVDVTPTHNALGRECLLFEITSPDIKKNALFINGIALELDETGGAMEFEPRHLLEIGNKIDCGKTIGDDDNTADPPRPMKLTVRPLGYTFVIVRPM
jgi:heparanase